MLALVNAFPTELGFRRTSSASKSFSMPSLIEFKESLNILDVSSSLLLSIALKVLEMASSFSFIVSNESFQSELPIAARMSCPGFRREYR